MMRMYTLTAREFSVVELFVIFLVLTLVVAASSGTAQALKCGTTTKNGKWKYDLSPLTKPAGEDYRILKKGLISNSFHLNICGNTATACNGKESAAAVWSVSGGDDKACLQSLGQMSHMKINPIDEHNATAGVMVEYAGGDAAGTGENSAIITMICVEGGSINTLPAFSGTEQTSTGYVYLFDWATPYACPIKNAQSVFTFGFILMYILLPVGFFLYWAIGVPIKYFIYKERTCPGLIPLFAFWMQLPGLVKDGFIFMIDGFKQCIVRIKGYRQMTK